MKTENQNLLMEGSKFFGIDLDGKTVEAFDLYLKELLKWNQKINLTAIRSEKGIILKHFIDALSASPYLIQPLSLLDIGSGAGFPGIPLKIVKPLLEVTLIDSSRKKIDFQRHIIRTLGLRGIEAIHGRIQDQEILRGMGGQFDVATSRAFSDLQTLLILSFPFLKKGGRVLVMKGRIKNEEIPLYSKTQEIRYRYQKKVSFLLPQSSIRRSILLFEKE
jgi:16S rRNA (guanine527-N7)-methyltransferase